MADYRWNLADFAKGYDEAAEHIHPFYVELQETILNLLPAEFPPDFLLVDVGGGSGKLAERFLRKYPTGRAIVVDQSEPFLELARRRFEPYGDRGQCVVGRLQADWPGLLPQAPHAIVSMSAIHHLDASEKQALYVCCHETLRPGGLFLNGDEVRAEDDATYLQDTTRWAAHMRRVIEAGKVSPPMADALRQWEQRNVVQFDKPRVSGDDCHETIETQVEYLHRAGFASVDIPWSKDMWAVFRAVKTAKI